MSDAINWQGKEITVQARLVPRFLWTTASIDVFLEGQCILRTGGQMKFTGSHLSTFTHAGIAHTTELRWGQSRRYSFPIELWIDGACVIASEVRIQNRGAGIAGATFLGTATALLWIVLTLLILLQILLLIWELQWL